MKALALTILTILTCLFIANLLAGNFSNSSQAAAALPARDAALPIVTAGAPARTTALAAADTAADAGRSGDRPSAASFAKRNTRNVPVSAFELAEPVAVDVAPMQVAAEAVAE
ncbi:MAG: hypothetical protein EHM21_05360, partial [Chloroflexi bacterium]